VRIQDKSKPRTHRPQAKDAPGLAQNTPRKGLENARNLTKLIFRTSCGLPKGRNPAQSELFKNSYRGKGAETGRKTPRRGDILKKIRHKADIQTKRPGEIFAYFLQTARETRRKKPIKSLWNTNRNRHNYNAGHRRN